MIGFLRLLFNQLLLLSKLCIKEQAIEKRKSNCYTKIKRLISKTDVFRILLMHIL